MSQDVGFQHADLKPLTHVSFRGEVPTPSVVEGQSAISFKPHILEHHIPVHTDVTYIYIYMYYSYI